jgi:cytochrome c
MGELGLNKILGALLATALGLMALHQLSAIVFSHGGEGHHGEEHAEATSLSEQMCAKYAYCVAVADSGGGGEAAEEVFDLGAALAAADVSKGERTFKAQCSTCHTIDDGGANGTGPNLHGVVGAEQGYHAGFAYSAAFGSLDGTWSYEHLNEWLNNPGSYVRGTAMSFAGLRRDGDRANVIAYLAANTPNAPAFPAPLAASSDEAAPADGEAAPAAEGEEATPAEGEAAPAEAAPTETVSEAVTEDADSATEADENTFTEDAPTPTDEENE